MKKTPDLAAALTRVAGGATSSTKPAPSAAADRKVLLVRLDPAVHRRLRVLAAEHDTTVQRLGEEAVDLLFERYEG